MNLDRNMAVRFPYRPLSPFRVIAMDLLGLGASFGALIGTDATMGGYILGGVLMFTIAIAVMIISSKVGSNSAAPMLFMMAGGLILNRLFEWWPEWTLVVAAIFLLAGSIGIFKVGEHTG